MFGSFTMCGSRGKGVLCVGGGECTYTKLFGGVVGGEERMKLMLPMLLPPLLLLVTEAISSSSSGRAALLEPLSLRFKRSFSFSINFMYSIASCSISARLLSFLCRIEGNEFDSRLNKLFYFFYCSLINHHFMR